MREEIRFCRSCGVPSIIAENFIWHTNGTITFRQIENYRMVILERDLIDAVFRGIESRIGLPIERIVIEAERKGTKKYVDSLLTGLKGRMIRAFGRKRVAEQLVKVGRAFGYGAITLKEYILGENVEVEVDDPYIPSLMVGNVAGSFESLEQAKPKFTWKMKGRRCIIKVEITAEESIFDERFRYKEELTLPGKGEHELCDGCNIPLAVSKEFQWDIENGSVTDSRDRRVFFIGLQHINSIFDELENELGEEIPSIMTDSVKAHVRRESEGLEDKDYLKGIEFFKLRGYGDPVALDRRDKGIEIKIQNPSNIPFLAGIVGGIFESAEGDAEIEWEKKDGIAIIRVR